MGVMPIPRGWHSRGHLPHADFAGLTQAVTFRLADALPATVLDRMRVDTAREAAGTDADELRSALNPGRADWPGLWIREGLRSHIHDTAD